MGAVFGYSKGARQPRHGQPVVTRVRGASLRATRLLKASVCVCVCHLLNGSTSTESPSKRVCNVERAGVVVVVVEVVEVVVVVVEVVGVLSHALSVL